MNLSPSDKAEEQKFDSTEDIIEDVVGRLGALVFMSNQMEKIDPAFSKEPLKGFVASITAEIDSIANDLIDNT